MPDLTVVWSPTQDEKAIDRDLKRLDEGLFLDKERDRQSGGLVWTVRHQIGSGVTPPLVLEWRDRQGNPLPLSSGIVYAVEKRKANFGRDLLQESMAANDALEEKQNAEAAEELEEIVRDFKKHYALGNFSVVPRSRALMWARARGRRDQARMNELARWLEGELRK